MGTASKSASYNSLKLGTEGLYGLQLELFDRGVLGEPHRPFWEYPNDFLIVTITCAWLLLKLLVVYSLRLSTQVQIYIYIFPPIFRPASEALPQIVCWAVRSPGPHTVALGPDPFSSSFPPVLPPLYSVMFLPTGSARLCRSYKSRCLNKKHWHAPLHFFKRRDVSCTGGSINNSSQAPCLYGCFPTHSRNGTTTRRGVFGWQLPLTPAMETEDERALWKLTINLYLRGNAPSVPSALMSSAVPRRLRTPSSLMREPSRLDIVGSGFSLQPMLFSPQRNEPSYSLIPFWHPWPKRLQSHPPPATTFSPLLSLIFDFFFVLFCCFCFGFSSVS